jgi:hypothetical protein
MYISVRRYRNVTSVRQVCGKIAQSFVPLLKRSPGFIAYYAVDGGGGTMATVSVFSTERMALESNDTAAQWLKENVAELQPEPPEIIAGKAEVAIHA